MKRLISTLVKKSDKYVPQVGDTVIFKRHPYDKMSYIVKEILPDGTVFMENNLDAYTSIKPSTLVLLKR